MKSECQKCLIKNGVVDFQLNHKNSATYHTCLKYRKRAQIVSVTAKSFIISSTQFRIDS